VTGGLAVKEVTEIFQQKSARGNGAKGEKRRRQELVEIHASYFFLAEEKKEQLGKRRCFTLVRNRSTLRHVKTGIKS